MSAGVAEVRDTLGAEKSAEADARAEALVRAHFTFVWRTVRRFGVTEADADDAAQRVFLIATRKLDRIDPEHQRAFLFRVAVRVADKARRARSRRPVSAETEPDEHMALSPGADELVDQRRARELLDSMLDHLSEDLRAVFVLYEVEQMTMAEIATLLGVPPGTVASRLRRARQTFQECLRRARARLENHHG